MRQSFSVAGPEFQGTQNFLPCPQLSNPCYSMFLQSYTTQLSNLFLPGLISHSPHSLPKPNSENTLLIKFPSLQGSRIALSHEQIQFFNPSLQPGLLFTAGKFCILHCRKLKQTHGGKRHHKLKRQIIISLEQSHQNSRILFSGQLRVGFHHTLVKGIKAGL